MKFAIAVVMLALAVVGVQSSGYGAWGPAVSYASHIAHPAGPWGGHWGGPAAVAVHSGWGNSGWGNSGWGHGGYPGISLSQGHGAAHHAAPIALTLGHGHGHEHEGVYVAKTRGAVHTAPLAGHINSATSLNVAPAPGTTGHH